MRQHNTSQSEYLMFLYCEFVRNLGPASPSAENSHLKVLWWLDGARLQTFYALVLIVSYIHQERLGKVNRISSSKVVKCTGSLPHTIDHLGFLGILNYPEVQIIETIHLI